MTVLIMPRPTPRGIGATCPWGHVTKCYCWSRGSDSFYCQPHPPEACCHWNFGAQASHHGLLGRPRLIKTVLCWGWSDRIASQVPEPWRRGWGICMEWGPAGKPSTPGSCPVVIMPIDPQGSPCWLPTATVSTWSGNRGDRTWQWPIGSMSSSVTSPDSNFTW